MECDRLGAANPFGDIAKGTSFVNVNNRIRTGYGFRYGGDYGSPSASQRGPKKQTDIWDNAETRWSRCCCGWIISPRLCAPVSD